MAGGGGACSVRGGVARGCARTPHPDGGRLQTRFGVSGGISELVLTEKKGVLTIFVTFELRQIFELRDATLKPTFGSNSHRKNLVP